MIHLPHKEYFEGILQLRNCNQEVQQWVRETVNKEGKAAITKEKKVKGGTDMYFSSQRYLQSFAKRLGERFVGITKTSATLHTRSRTGEDLYRVTILFKQLPFKRGEVVTFQGEEYEIESIRKRVQLKNIKTGKRTMISLETATRMIS